MKNIHFLPREKRKRDAVGAACRLYVLTSPYPHAMKGKEWNQPRTAVVSHPLIMAQNGRLGHNSSVLPKKICDENAVPWGAKKLFGPPPVQPVRSICCVGTVGVVTCSFQPRKEPTTPGALSFGLPFVVCDGKKLSQASKLSRRKRLPKFIGKHVERVALHRFL